MPRGVYPRGLATLDEKLAARIDSSGAGCWPWIGDINRDGYGRMRVGHHGPTRMAHDLVWEVANGPIPLGKRVLHRCDNPPCCKLSDLFLGTQADNVADMVSKGRQRTPRGERHGNSKFTDEQVREIRKRHASGESYSALAREFRVWPTTIHDIVNRYWRHV